MRFDGKPRNLATIKNDGSIQRIKVSERDQKKSSVKF